MSHRGQKFNSAGGEVCGVCVCMCVGVCMCACVCVWVGFVSLCVRLCGECVCVNV